MASHCAYQTTTTTKYSYRLRTAVMRSKKVLRIAYTLSKEGYTYPACLVLCVMKVEAKLVHNKTLCTWYAPTYCARIHHILVLVFGLLDKTLMMIIQTVAVCSIFLLHLFYLLLSFILLGSKSKRQRAKRKSEDITAQRHSGGPAMPLSAALLFTLIGCLSTAESRMTRHGKYVRTFETGMIYLPGIRYLVLFWEIIGLGGDLKET